MVGKIIPRPLGNGQFPGPITVWSRTKQNGAHSETQQTRSGSNSVLWTEVKKLEGGDGDKAYSLPTESQKEGAWNMCNYSIEVNGCHSCLCGNRNAKLTYEQATLTHEAVFEPSSSVPISSVRHCLLSRSSGQKKRSFP